MAEQARTEMDVEKLEAVADRGYYEGEEIKDCEGSGISVTLPKPQTSGAKAGGHFGKQDFVYVAANDTYRCPAGERLTYRFSGVEKGKTIRRYWTNACKTCALKAQCTTGAERRIRRWEHEAVLEKVQTRLDHNPDAMRVRRSTVEHPFGTIKCWMGATHFLMTHSDYGCRRTSGGHGRLSTELHAEIKPHRSPFNDPGRQKGDLSADFRQFAARRA
jgi:hypothetical protein